jgi:hypothetical protein
MSQCTTLRSARYATASRHAAKLVDRDAGVGRAADLRLEILLEVVMFGVGEVEVEKAGFDIHKRSLQLDNVGMVETAEDPRLLAQVLTLLQLYEFQDAWAIVVAWSGVRRLDAGGAVGRRARPACGRSRWPRGR